MAQNLTVEVIPGLLPRANEVLAEIMADIAARENIDKARKVVISISIKPHVDETGQNMPTIETEVKSVIPARKLTVLTGQQVGDVIRVRSDDPFGPATVQQDMIDPAYNQKIQTVHVPQAAER